MSETTTAQRRAVEVIDRRGVFYDPTTGRGITLPEKRAVVDRRTMNALVEAGLVAQDATGRLHLTEAGERERA